MGQAHSAALHEVLGSRYVMFGEWTYAKHTVYYDALPHYFLEFDVLDRETETFLSTPRRRALLGGIPITSVPVLAEQPFRRKDDLLALVGPSRFKSPTWRDRLSREAQSLDLDPEKILEETDPSNEMEGLYIKVEDDGRVIERLKWVRQGFLAVVVDSGTHWLSRPIVPNRLAGDRAIDSLFDVSS